MRALLIHPGFLGDTVFLGPAVHALKKRWPDGRVAVCTTPRGAPVAELLPGCDEVVVFDKRGQDRGLRGLIRVGRALRRFAPELALVSHPSLRSGALAWLSGASCRIGYPRLFCTERVPFDRRRPFVDRVLALVSRAGSAAAEPERTLRLDAPERLSGYADRVLTGTARPLVGLVPGAEWQTKRWGAEKYALVAAELSAQGAAVVILGGPLDRELASRIGELAGTPVCDSTGNSIAEAIALLARCDLVIGGDTGLVHCARALGRKVLVLFGPTDPRRQVFGARDRPISLGLACQPCHRHGPQLCPLGHHHCMALLNASAVLDAARTFLDACKP